MKTLFLWVLLLLLKQDEASNITGVGIIVEDIDKGVSKVIAPFNFTVYFYFYGRNNPSQFQELITGNEDSILNSNYNPNLDTKFIIHGLYDGVNKTSWQKGMKNEFLEGYDVNVILVDWSEGAPLPPSVSVLNSPNAAEQISNLIRFLMNVTGADVSSLHLIGHSQGAHVAGLVGQMIPDVPRISSLDPSGAYVQRLPSQKRLSPDDANLVDVIQTNGVQTEIQGFGAKRYLGNLEFVANNGTMQPGCGFFGDIEQAIQYPFPEAFRRFIACSHYRSIDLYTESINYKNCPLVVAYACSNYSMFLEGQCAECNDGKSCAIVGYKADEYKYYDESQGIGFFFKTSGKPPYCLYAYQVLVSISENQKGTAGGVLRITLNRRDETVVIYGGPSGFTSGSNRTALFTSETGLPACITSIEVHWTSVNFRPIHINYIRILPMNHIDPRIREERTRYFCTRHPVLRTLQKNIFTIEDCELTK